MQKLGGDGKKMLLVGYAAMKQAAAEGCEVIALSRRQPGDPG